MAKGSGSTRSGNSSNARGLSQNSYGDTITNFNRNYLFNNPTIREAIQKEYPNVSFGSSGDSLTVVGADSNTAGKVIDLIKKEREKMVEKDVRAIRNATFQSEIGGQWNLSTPKADTSIVLEDEPFLGKTYRVSVIGSYDSNGSYDTVEPKVNRFSTLAKAKETAKAYLEDYYIKRNKYDKIAKFE